MDNTLSNKELILQCALKLFSAKGYTGTSVQELVNMAKITKPTLYYYFGSKEGVYESLLNINYSNLNKIVLEKSVYNPNPKEYFKDTYPVLVKLAESYFQFAKNNSDFYKMVLGNLFMPNQSEIYSVLEKYHFIQYDIVTDLFLNISNIHFNLKGKEKILSLTFIGTINSYIGIYFSQIENIKLDNELAKIIVHQFMHGIY